MPAKVGHFKTNHHRQKKNCARIPNNEPMTTLDDSQSLQETAYVRAFRRTGYVLESLPPQCRVQVQMNDGRWAWLSDTMTGSRWDSFIGLSKQLPCNVLNDRHRFEVEASFLYANSPSVVVYRDPNSERDLWSLKPSQAPKNRIATIAAKIEAKNAAPDTSLVEDLRARTALFESAYATVISAMQCAGDGGERKTVVDFSEPPLLALQEKIKTKLQQSGLSVRQTGTSTVEVSW